MTDRKPGGPPIPPFHAGEIGQRGSARRRAGLPVIAMNFGQPSAPAPATALAVAHRVLDADALGYIELVPLRERIARHYQDTYGVKVDPKRIILTAGASAGLVATFAALFTRGDRVAIVRPGYPAYRNTLRALGLQAVELPCTAAEGFNPSPARLAAINPAPAGFVLASPANPTGAMLDRGALGELIEVCLERGIRFISDEIYHGIQFGERAVSALEIDPEALVINSFSKLYRMPGWRLGWMVAPTDLASHLYTYVMNLFLTPPTLAQHAALAAFDAPADLQHWVGIYRQNRDRLIAGLTALGIAGIRAPEGAFYLYADLGRYTRDSLDFCRRAVDEIGVALAPGIDFDPVDGHTFVRFSFAVTPQEIELALALLADWLPKQRP